MRSYHWLWVVGLILLLTAVTAPLLNGEALRYDERWTLYNAGGDWYAPMSLGDVWTRIAQDDPWQSPGYFLILNVWGNLVGWSVLAARVFSPLMGALALAAMYRLGAEVAGRRVGVYSAAILAGSAFFAYYWHEMRPYTLYALFTCLAVWAYWRVMMHGGGRGVQATFVLSLTALAYTHPLALLPALAIRVYHLIFAPKNRLWWLMSGLMVVSAALYTPWILVLLDAIAIAQSDVTRQAVSLSAAEMLTTFPTAFSSGSVAFLALLVAFSPSRRLAFRLVVLWLGVGLAGALAINAFLPVFVHIRYLMALWPALALLAAFGVERLHQRGVTAGVVLAIWIVTGMLAASTPDFFASLKNSERSIGWDGLRVAVTDINRWASDGETAIFHTRPPGLEWQNLGVLDTWLHGSPVAFESLEFLNPNSEALEGAYRQAVNAYLAPFDGVWTVVLPDVPHTSRQTVFFRALERDFTRCLAENVGDDGVQIEYALRRQIWESLTPITFTLPEGGQIHAAIARWQFAPEAFRLVLLWETDESVPVHLYSAFIHLSDAKTDALLAQSDQAIPAGEVGCMTATFDLAGMSSPEMRVWLGVYNWQTVQRVPFSSGVDDRASLGILTNP